MINKERVLKEFFELVQIKASTREERQVADVLKARLAQLGLEVTEDNVGEKIGGNCGNVLGYLKGSVPSAPRLMFSAHMDCVECCEGIEPVLKDGVICSAGNTILGSDDKSGAVAILEALRCLKEEKLAHGDIQVIFTVAEEGGLNGSKNMDRTLLKADMGYALDSSGTPGEIITMAPGQDKIEALIHGKKAHAGLAPEEGVNAIVVASRCMADMKQGRIDAETTANIGVIKGGTVTNIVPDLVEVVAEARSRNLEKLSAQTAHMKETFEKVAAANGARAEVKVVKSYDPYVLAEDAPVVNIARQAAESIGLKAACKGTGGGSDANFFNSYGVPTTVLATGMTKVHTADEFILEKDLYSICELVLAIIKTAAGK